MRIRPEKLVVTSNFYPSQCFTHQEDIEPIRRRFRVIEDLADLPPIPEEVPLDLLVPLGREQEEVPQEEIPQEVQEDVFLEVQVSREEEQEQAPLERVVGLVELQVPREGEQEESPLGGGAGLVMVQGAEIPMGVWDDWVPGEEEQEPPRKKPLVQEDQVSREGEEQQEQEDALPGQRDQRCNQQ